MLGPVGDRTPPACRELTVEERTRPHSLMHVLQDVATGAGETGGRGGTDPSS